MGRRIYCDLRPFPRPHVHLTWRLLETHAYPFNSGTVACFGLGGVIVPAATVAMIAAPDALITTCAALSLSVRAVGGAIGYSIYFNVSLSY